MQEGGTFGCILSDDGFREKADLNPFFGRFLLNK